MRSYQIEVSDDLAAMLDRVTARSGLDVQAIALQGLWEIASLMDAVDQTIEQARLKLSDKKAVQDV